MQRSVRNKKTSRGYVHKVQGVKVPQRQGMDKAVLTSTLLALVLYVNTWPFGFVYDDNRAILTNQDVLPGTNPVLDLLKHDFWGTPLQHSGSHGSYRPLTVLSFRFNVRLGGADPMGFHILNTMLHAAATAACTSLARRLAPSRPLTPWLVGLLFAAHPIHTEAVAGIVGRADVGAALFFLLALLNYMEHPSQLGSTLTFGTCATLTKETGVTVFLVCFLYDLVALSPRGGGPVQTLRSLLPRRGRKEDWPRRRRLLTLVGFTALLVVGRTWLTGGRLPTFATADNPASKSDCLLTRTLTFLYLPVFNLWLMLCPTVLSFDWSMDAVPLVRSPLDPRNLLTVLLYSALAWSLLVHLRRICRDHVGNSSKRFRSQEREDAIVVLMGIILLTVPFLPASNLLAYVGFVVAERVLYLPSIGFCLLVGHGMSIFRPRKSVLWLAVNVLAFLALRTIIRNRDWRSEEALYRSGISVNPPKAYGNLGNILSMKGEIEEAEMCYRRALQYRPNMADVHYNLGVLLQNQERLDEAMYRYRVAIQCRPQLAVAHLNLGLVLSKVNKHEESHAILRGCADLDSEGLRDPRGHEIARVACLFHLGRLSMEQGNLQKAIEVFLEAINDRPHFYAPQLETLVVLQSLYNMLGEAYSRLGKYTEAEPWFRASLSTRPKHVPAHLTYGKLLARNKTRAAEAEQWYSKAESLAPKNPEVFRHFGQFLMAQKRYSEAAVKLETAVKLASPNPEYEDVISTATSLRLAGDFHSAERYYKLAISLRPTEPSSIANLGALYHLTGRFEEAEARYQEALKLLPEDDVTLANLKRLSNLQRLRAEKQRLHRT